MASVNGTEESATQVLPPTHEGQTEQASNTSVDPAKIAGEWTAKAQKCFDGDDKEGLAKLFMEDGWWRDILTLDFDMNTLTPKEFTSYFNHIQKPLPKLNGLEIIRPAEAELIPVAPGLEWIQAFLKFENEHSRGTGLLRLKQVDGKGPWLAYTFFTQLWEVKGHEEFSYHRRPRGAEHGEHIGKLNWLDKRQEKVKFEGVDPTVLVIGGGQNGLMIAARLGALGLDTLVVDKSERIGDCWRKDITRCACTTPYGPITSLFSATDISYPPHWPIYTPKDKLANWFESYAEAMELNVWMESTVTPGATYDPQTGSWTVEIVRGGASPLKRTMKPRYIVMATGFSGEAKMPKFPMSDFSGEICHSSKHKGGQPWKGKKAVVIGCCNSGHDIAADFYEQGVDVTIVQRSHTYVMSSEHGIPGLLNGYYEEDGPPLADADLLLTSFPINVLEQFHIGATTAIGEKDKVILDRLEKAGFKLNRYPAGLFIKYFRDGGGYYIDVGCSSLIADGKVKIKQGKEITKLTKSTVAFEDGVELPADIVVCATGYGSMRDTVRNVIGSHVADTLGPVWGCDKQGEIPGAWKLCGQPGFWLMCGNFFQARCFSKHVAMQIQLQELGLADKNFAGRLDKADPDPRF